MWTFDQDKYQKQILVPAVDEFMKSGGANLPDIFERYALPLEISDLPEIQNATKTVLAFWNKTKENSRFGPLLKVLIAEDKERVRELADEKSRESCCGLVKEERKKKQEKRFVEVDNVVKLLASKGYLLPEEKKSLIAKFTSSGLTEQEIVSRIKVPIEERIVKPPDQGFDSNTRKKVRTNLAVLKKSNLYEFLEIQPKTTRQELEKKFQALSSEWNKKKNDNNKIAANALLSFIKDKLLNEGLEKYERSLVWDVIDDELRTQVEFAAADRKISREEFETLINHGSKFGLSIAQTTEAILWLAQEKGAVVELSERADTVACAECHANIPQNNNKCTSCGKDLWTVCPKCKTKIAASDVKCGNCGCSTADRYRVSLLIRKVHFALDEKNLEDALKFAREAERIWGNTDDVTIILNKVKTLNTQAETYRKDYDEALKQKKLFTARSSLAMLAGISPKYKCWDNKTPEQLQRDLETQYQKVENLLTEARKYEGSKNTNEAVRVYQDILNIAVDVEEALQGLKSCPPERVSNVTAKAYDGQIVVEWRKSPAVGNLDYLVVRCENRPPASASDGKLVAKVSNNSFCDESARPASFFYYGIFTERGGVHSPCAVSNGILAIKEVEDFALEVGEAIVRGSWKFSVPEGKIRVLCGSEDLLRKDNGRAIHLTNPHTFEDSNLTNGQTYNYRVFVEYKANGKTVTTTGKFGSATPEMPPQPIERLEIRLDDGKLHFQWDPPAFGSVSIYRLERKPEWKYGTQIPIASLAKLGQPLRNAPGGFAVDPDPAIKQVYYTPFTIAGDGVVVGQTKSFITAEEITNLRVQDFESYLLLQWKWTANFQSVIVAWRHDSYPNDVNDSLAVRQKVTRGEYDTNGGFRISNPKKRPYKFVVFTITELDDKPTYSGGLNQDCRAEVRTESVVKIDYSLKSKGWWKKSFVVSLNCEEQILSLPELLLVAKPGENQPLDSESGRIIARITNAALQPQLPFEYEFEMPGLKRPFFVRLFFAAANSYKSYKLSDPPPAQLKMR